MAGSALISISLPPLSRSLPAPLVAFARELTMPMHRAVGAIDPTSIFGRLFFGTYDPLVPLFGSAALVVHSLLLSLPLLALAIWIGLYRGRIPSPAA